MVKSESKGFGIHLSVILRRGQMYLNRELEPLGVKAGQIPILWALGIKEGVEQKRIRKYLHMDKGSIAKTIRPLIDKGYLIRKTNPKDKRAYQIFLTPKGHAIMPAVKEAVKSWTDSITAGFTEEEKATAYSLITRMSENARQHLKPQGTHC